LRFNTGKRQFKAAKDLFDQEGPVEAACRYVRMAEKFEEKKNYDEAIKNYQIASEEYLKAKALLKQTKDFEEASLKSLELLSDSCKRKSKILRI